VRDAASVGAAWRVPARLGEPLTLRRFVAVYTSNEVADPMSAAIGRVEQMRWADFDEALAAHVERWSGVWKRSAVRIAGSPATEQALRFGAYHLVSAADRDPRISVGGRALTGRAYEGHIFWDVEIFKFPFYLHSAPDVARNLLWYRYNTLGGARRRARAMSCSGACFAWESTVTGDDVTPRTIELKTSGKAIPIFTGSQQLHVTSAVAYALWRYWQATQDHNLLREIGVEILVETARFWTSRCTRGGRHLHIRDVVGPDEYHHSVDDNAYTNWMARFNLERAVAAVEWMVQQFSDDWRKLSRRLEVAADEPRAWASAARELFCPAPNAHGVIEQFDGFFALEDYPLPREERFKAPISRLFDWERINRLKLIKQADVLMLPFLFPDAFSAAVVEANYRYYEPMTDHGSSLSPGVHAAIAARLGIRNDAERYWRESLWLDLSNGMGNSALGIHPACMGATWQALVFAFLGVHFTEDGPRCTPNAGARLLPSWSSVELELAWRGSVHSVRVERERLE
jgi:alpha,alpha-trehalose phosphorylase